MSDVLWRDIPSALATVTVFASVCILDQHRIAALLHALHETHIVELLVGRRDDCYTRFRQCSASGCVLTVSGHAMPYAS